MAGGIDTIYGLTEGDQRKLQDLLRQFEQLGLHASSQPGEDTVTAPELYVARTPSPQENPPNGGIPGLVEESGAGIRDEPGNALCKLYRVLRDEADTKWQLRPYPEFRQRVFNLQLEAVPPEVWVVVARDKGGTWWALRGGGGELTGVARVTADAGNGYYNAVLGAGAFNPATKTFAAGKAVWVGDVATFTIPNPPP